MVIFTCLTQDKINKIINLGQGIISGVVHLKLAIGYAQKYGNDCWELNKPFLEKEALKLEIENIIDQYWKQYLWGLTVIHVIWKYILVNKIVWEERSITINTILNKKKQQQ